MMNGDPAAFARDFILRHDEIIRSRVNLDVLVPKLYNAKLLTSSERENALYTYHPPPGRLEKLVTVLSKKGKDVPRLLIECLREAREHLPHAELADILEKALSSARSNITSGGHSNAQRNIIPNYSNTQPGPSTASTCGSVTHPSANPSHTPQNISADVPRQQYVDATLNPQNQLAQYSPQYATLLSGISSELKSKRLTFNDIKDALTDILHCDGILLELPPDVCDFSSLWLYLHQVKMCHEADVDLLCKLLQSLRQDYLLSVVDSYADSLSSVNVMKYRYQSQNSPTGNHFIAFTFHNKPTMTAGEAYEIKQYISDVLHIPRHTFSLAGADTGSIRLAWQIPMEYLKHFQSSVAEDSEVRESLSDSKYQFDSIKLLLERGAQCEEVYSSPSEENSGNEGVASSGVHLSSCQDDCISSTNDGVSSSAEYDAYKDDSRTHPSSSVEEERSCTDIRPPPTKQLKLSRQIVTGAGSLASLKRSSPFGHHASPSKRFQSDYQSSSSGYPRFSETPPEDFSAQYIPKKGYSKASSDGEKSPRDILIRTVRACYKSDGFFRRAAGPNVGKLKFINLALVKKQNVNEDEKEIDKFLKHTLHGSIDDIVKKKERMSVTEIFSYGRKQPRKLVLVEGAPGVGKTMLALKLCSDWANGLALQEYDLVLLIQLRRFQGKTNITLEDIIRTHLDQPELASEVSKDLWQHNERVLLILEGWDELSPQLRGSMSFFFDIIEANKLPDASVLVTSRPTVTSELYDYMDERHIEVLGFSPDQIKEYIEAHASSHAESILTHLSNFPNLKALAHIPLTLAIICRLARDQVTLPPTLTELYNNHICNLLYQNLKRQISLLGLDGLSQLPPENRAVVESLCKLALQGMEDKKFVFKSEDLREVGLNPRESFDGYGLLSTPITSATAGHELLYQFGHLSIQEFLAAYQIKSLKGDERIRLLEDFREDKQFQNVWKFLSGITKLKEEEFQQSIISSTTANNRDQVFLTHCLFEAHDAEICCKGAEKLLHTLNINNMSLNTTDCLCAAYVISTAGGDWTVDLRGCNIGADGMAVLKSHFESHSQIPEAERTDFKIKELNLTHNRITGQAVSHLADILKMNVDIVKLFIGSNALDEEGLRKLTEALSENKTVSAIHISSCELTPACGGHVADMLRKNRCLKELYIGFEPLGDEGVCSIVSALEENSTLVDLSLTKTDISRKSLECCATVLEHNKSLEVIRFDRDCVRPGDCHIIADMISRNNSLVLLDMSKNPIRDEGFKTILRAMIQKPNGSLKKLGVFGCEITSEGLSELIELFRTTEVFEGIQLGCNALGDKGAEVIGTALQANVSKSVKQVLLESTGVSQAGKEKLAEIVNALKVDREKLDVNYDHHAQVIEKRSQTNYVS